MKRAAAIAAAILIVLVLSGCQQLRESNNPHTTSGSWDTASWDAATWQ